jgi:protein phosphatase
MPELTHEENATIPAIENPGKMVAMAVNIANKTIYDLSKKDSSLQGMGTTIVAALITGQDLFLTSVGDSRCYIINANEIVQVTRDHSLAQEMLEAGLIAPDEVRTHPRKNVLTHVLGYEEKVEADSFNRKLYQGDNVLLCSDGMWGVLTDPQIKETVLKAEDPQQACIDLVAQANEAGGPDNISVIIVRPERLPIRQEVLEAETQVMATSGRSGDGTASPERKGFFSLFQKKRP